MRERALVAPNEPMLSEVGVLRDEQLIENIALVEYDYGQAYEEQADFGRNFLSSLSMHPLDHRNEE